jgi:hypothetical protein
MLVLSRLILYISCMPFETELEDPIGLLARRGEDDIT